MRAFQLYLELQVSEHPLANRNKPPKQINHENTQSKVDNRHFPHSSFLHRVHLIQKTFLPRTGKWFSQFVNLTQSQPKQKLQIGIKAMQIPMENQDALEDLM
jgi:hypothetical protein